MDKNVKDILEIVIAFVVAFSVYQILAVATGTGMPIVSVVSDSMLPVLHRGDLLLVIKDNDPQIGNIDIYDSASSSFTIVHRIVKIENGQYTFKGDNNPVPDRLTVSKSQIKGKVVFALPLLGYPRLALYAIGI